MTAYLEAGYFTRLRLDIALVYSGRRRTLYEGAKALGKPSGSIQRAVRRMHEDGALEASDREPTQGTLYWLNPDADEALEKALVDSAPTGMLTNGQRYMEVRLAERRELHKVLSRQEFGGLVHWAAELDSDERWLVAIAPWATRLQADRMRAAMTAAGAECALRRVGDLYGREEWRRAGTAIEEAIA